MHITRDIAKTNPEKYLWHICSMFSALTYCDHNLINDNNTDINELHIFDIIKVHTNNLIT